MRCNGEYGFETTEQRKEQIKIMKYLFYILSGACVK